MSFCVSVMVVGARRSMVVGGSFLLVDGDVAGLNAKGGGLVDGRHTL